MTQNEITEQQISAEVSSALDEAYAFTREISLEEAQNGDWFIKLLRKVIASYETNARAAYFQQKYPGLSDDEIADKLISVTVRYAAIAGAIGGVTTSVNQLGALASGGLTAALWISSIGVEMVYLARIQFRLILDLSIVYDLQLDLNDPEDILMLFGYALGIKPAEIIGKGLQVAAASLTTLLIKEYISKGTLKSVQEFGRLLGFKILQQTIIKYAVPAASAAVGSCYNYSTTLYIGKIAKTHFKNRGKVTLELRELITKQNTYALVFPAAVLYMAQVDGEFDGRERELYNAILSRMSFDEHDARTFKMLAKDEVRILDAIKLLDDENQKQSLLDLLIMMALYDGELKDTEIDYLTKAAEQMNLSISVEELRERSKQYKIEARDGVWEKVSARTSSIFTTINNQAQSTGSGISSALKSAGEQGNALMRRLGNLKNSQKTSEET